MERSEFIAVVSAALGRTAAPSVVNFDSPCGDVSDIAMLAETLRAELIENSANLVEPATVALEEGGWKVHRASTLEDVGGIVLSVCADSNVSTAVLTDHTILEDANLNAVLCKDGIDVALSRSLADGNVEEERRDQIESAKQRMFETDLSITGGDYVIAETGTLVVHPSKGVARLASLAPPIHIAVVHSNQLMPSLDDLFLLEHADLMAGDRASGMNLISGPSRTGDIEAQIVYGIHGPVEAHIVLVG